MTHTLSAWRWAAIPIVMWGLIELGTPTAWGQSFTAVPGEVIAYDEYTDKSFLGTPSITIAPNGDYYVSHDIFGDDTTQNINKIFRSTNDGLTWTLQSTVTDAFHSTIFHNSSDGALYLFGMRDGDYGNRDVLIRKSTNNGVTWTTPTNSTNGLLIDNDFAGQAASIPVVYDGRLWLARGGKAIMSAPVGSNLLLANSWAFTGDANVSSNPWGASGGDITEGQVVASPLNGMTIMPKIGDQPGSGVIRVNPNDPTDFFTPTASDWIDMPGGEKKFGATYDSVSGKFYALSNPVLAAHASSGILSGLIRNTAALLSSKDQKHWDVEKVFLYSPHLDNGSWGEAFQYLSFAVDGNDMAVVSRTAYDTDGDASNAGQNLPPKGHDSNLITFHRIDDFRTAAPTQVLVADTLNNRVLRYEANQAPGMAPIGTFNLGSTFAGTALTKPVGVAQASNGDVYVNEALDTGGRILRFDAAGNFLDVVATGGTNFTGRPEAMTIGPDGNLYMSVAFGASNSDKIYKINTSTKAVTTFVNTSFTGGTLNNPRGIAFGSDGNLYVADSTNGKIRKFNGSTGAFISNIVSTTSPLGLVWDPAKNKLLFTAQVGSDLDVYETTLAGSTTKLYDPNNVGTGLGLADINGQVFWTDFDKDDIYLLNGNNNKINSVYSNINGVSYMTPTAILQPTYGERSWIKTGAGDFADINNWYYWGRPDTNYEVAVFGSAIGSNSTVTVNQAFTTKGLRFRNDNKYTLSGSGSITLEADTGNSVVDLQLGQHDIAVSVTLNSNTDVTLASGTRLRFLGSVNLNGKTLSYTGPGQRDVLSSFSMNGGTLETDGQNQISFGAGTTTTLNGTFKYTPWAGANLSLGATHTLFNSVIDLDGTFSKINIAAIANSTRGWSTANLYTSGSVSIIDVPNPEWNVNANGNWEDSSNWLNHGIPNSNLEIAYFKELITGSRTISMNSSYTLKGLRFADSNNDSYFIDGTGSITISANSGNGVIEVVSGTHEIRNPVTLNSNTNWTVPSSTRLYFKDTLNLNGKTLTVTGPGNRNIDAVFSMASGKLVTDGWNQITFGSSATGTLNGTLQFLPYTGASLALGASHDLFNGINFLTGTFGTLQLPTLGSGLSWNTSNLYTTGIITVVSGGGGGGFAAPEPSSLALLGFGLLLSSIRRRRNQ